MINKFYKLLFLAAMLLQTAAGYGQTIGYTNCTFEANQGIRLGNGTTQGIAIKLGKEKATLLKGQKISKIHAAFYSKRFTDMSLFITSSLEGTPQYSQPIASASSKWAEYPLTTPFEITGEELYIGFKGEIATAFTPLSFDYSYGTVGTSWVYENDSWKDVYDKGYGAANIQLILEGDKKFTDITIKPIQIDGYYKENTPYIFQGQLFNFGTEKINTLEITYVIDKNEPKTIFLSDVNLESGKTYDFSLPEITVSNSGEILIKTIINKINGRDVDDEPTDNVFEGSTYFYPQSIERKLLLENFTGQECPNCPDGHDLIKKVTKEMNDIIIVSHHSGHQPDAFTMKEDWEFCRFYNSSNGQIYAPALMINRFQNPNLQSPTPGPVFQPSESNITGTIETLHKRQPYVSIDIATQYDYQNKNLTGEVIIFTHTIPEGDLHALNLFIIQDSIVDYQAGASLEYIHNHVFRGTLFDSYYGVKVDLKVGEYITKAFSYTLPETILSTYEGNGSKPKSIPTELKQMSLVAFVAGFDEIDPNKFEVFNSNNIRFGESTPGAAAIGEVNEENSKLTVFVQGNQVYINPSCNSLEVYNAHGSLIKKQTGEISSFCLENGFYVLRTVKDGKVASHKLIIAD